MKEKRITVSVLADWTFRLMHIFNNRSAVVFLVFGSQIEFSPAHPEATIVTLQSRTAVNKSLVPPKVLAAVLEVAIRLFCNW